MEGSGEERRGEEEESRDEADGEQKRKADRGAVDDKRGHRERRARTLSCFSLRSSLPRSIISMARRWTHICTLEIAGGAGRVIGLGSTVRPIDLNFGDVAGNNVRLRFLTGP